VSALVRFDQLPAGVQPIKDYPSLDATLVQCTHAHPGPDRCAVCKGDAYTTGGYTRPVKASYRLNPRNLHPHYLTLCLTCRNRLHYTLVDYGHIPGGKWTPGAAPAQVLR
jgi:hypothetical protein